MYRGAVIMKCIVLYLTVEIVRLKSGHVVVQVLIKSWYATDHLKLKIALSFGSHRSANQFIIHHLQKNGGGNF